MHILASIGIMKLQCGFRCWFRDGSGCFWRFECPGSGGSDAVPPEVPMWFLVRVLAWVRVWVPV